jgi:FAD:protein FMN transferase
MPGKADRVAIPLTLSVCPADRPKGEVRHLAGTTMGTTWSVKFIGSEAAAYLQQPLVEAALARVVAQMSPWDGRSDLSRFNRSPLGEWQALPVEFADVIRCALRIAEETAGAYDPTMGALVDHWGFGAQQPPVLPPSPGEIDCARRAAGWKQLEFDPPGDRLRRFSRARLDLNGVAKGFAVDLITATLKACGIEHALVEIGGELSGTGTKPDGTPWWVVIDAPASCGLSQAMPLVALHQLAIATSGLERGRTVGDRTLSHTIDPSTGSPIDNGMVTASVLHASCMEADAYATALMVMGPEAGMAFTTRHQLAALCLFRSAEGQIMEWISPAFEAMLS